MGHQPDANGLVVNGDDVTIYGLFNEHHAGVSDPLERQRRPRYMYQSEMPYDVPGQAAWMNGDPGYASYKVAAACPGTRLGASASTATSAMPPSRPTGRDRGPGPGVKFHNLTTIWLDGKQGSEITHIINDLGGRVHANPLGEAMRQTLREFGGQRPRPKP